ncbi:unnamed protein product [Periconia digitata]|uniref:peptidylprolyl isomerase n=1 Tax=Periconia digitata TaxID=1303443 RepID=A0A9W4UK78_9PLEO|nr:unnamed protein product [Periconia digitata]
MKLTILPLLATLSLATAEIINNEYLKTEVTTPATCTRKTKAGDKVDVHYRGTLEKDGSEFDASYNRGQPLSFSVGTGQVIKGWDQGLLDMCPGEKRKLTIQPDWGYGARGAGPIPANAVLSKSGPLEISGTIGRRLLTSNDLVFETELVSINGQTKDEL